MRISTTRVAAISILTVVFAAPALQAQTVDPGRKAFESRCARCHGGEGDGGEMGPPIRERLTARDNDQLATLIHEGLPPKGMPPNDAGEPETTDLVKFLR